MPILAIPWPLELVIFLFDRCYSLVDDVIAAVDIERFARDEARGVVSEESGGDADIVDADKTLRAGAFVLALSSSASNSGIPEAARVASGPGEMAWTRMPLGPSSAAR